MGILFINQHMSELFSFIKGHQIISVPDQHDVDPRLMSHVDLSVFVANDFIVVHKNVYETVKEQLMSHYDITWIKKHLIQGRSTLGMKYPEDIPFNAIQLKNHFFHKTAKTEEEILKRIPLTTVNTNQGYTRCSTLKIDEQSVITEDQGLARLYTANGYDVLLIQKGFVELPGFSYGFFGGAGGRIKDDIVFNGSLANHPDEAAIIRFIEQRGLRIKTLHSNKLQDCGSFHFYDAET